MGLTSSLFTALSGLNVNQTALNVVSNNIANANTTAFKSSMAVFTPQYYVTDSAGTAATTDLGGSNPSQEGMGAQVSNVSVDLSQGTLQSTGLDTDMAISGQGYFIINNAGQQMYTRDGQFSLNSNNQLTTGDGSLVQGYGVDSAGTVQSGTLQNLIIPLGQETTAKATANITLQGNLNSGGNVSTGSSVIFSQSYYDAAGNAPTSATLLSNLQTENGGALQSAGFTAGTTYNFSGVKGSSNTASTSFTVTPTSTLGDLATFIQNSLGIDPNGATPAGGAAPGVTIATASGDTSGARLQIVGNGGTVNALSLSSADFSSGGGQTPISFADNLSTISGVTNDPSGESTTLGVTAYDSLGTPVEVDVTAVLAGKSSTGTTWQFYASSPTNQGGSTVVGDGTISFDQNGKMLSQTGNTITLDRAGTGAVAAQPITLNFSNVNSLADTTSTLVSPSQDGFAIGSLSSFSVGTDGTITGSFTNGMTRTIGQVALATFSNPQGLVNNGSNEYSAGAASGQAQIAAPNSLGVGTVQSGALEESNVDISTEFVQMIIASTGFSASSKVISTSDQLITDLLNSH